MDDKQSSQRQHDLETVADMRLLDDDFMREVFNEYPEGTELLLNIILGRTDLTVEKVIGQREVKNPVGRSARLDIQAVDSTGKAYDIEIQRADKGAGFRRARYNSSLLDSTMLLPGQDHDMLRDSYVIFITESDVFGAGLPIYHIERTIQELDVLFGDGSHIMYVNNDYQNSEDNIGKLMHDFRCTDADEMYFKVLADRVKYFKENEGGQEIMCRAIEKERDIAAYNKSIEIALNFIRKGYPIEDIADSTNLPIEKVRELAEKQSA